MYTECIPHNLMLFDLLGWTHLWTYEHHISTYVVLDGGWRHQAAIMYSLIYAPLD